MADNNFNEDLFIDDEVEASYIDKEDYLDMLSTSDNVYWDESKYTFDEFQSILEKAIDNTVNQYTRNGNFYVEDWDVFDSDLVDTANKLLGNDEDE